MKQMNPFFCLIIIILGGNVFSFASSYKNDPDKLRKVLMQYCRTGDILLCFGPSSANSGLGVFISGRWKHAGLYDQERLHIGNDFCILSASNQTDVGKNRVGYESLGKWCKENEIVILRVRGRTDANAKAALSYAQRFIGKPFSFATERDDNRTWYCSKLVYRAWLSQGFTLEPKPWKTDSYVTPQDIFDDDDVFVLIK